ncbi:MAG: hypothetical protein ABL970_03355 [Nitrospira sp.]
MHTPLRLFQGTTIGMVCLALCACSSGSDGTAPPALPASSHSIDNTTRTAAATTTADNNSACVAIKPFYWEIGDRTQLLGSASLTVGGNPTAYTADSLMNIASASKWLYGAYVAERRSGALTTEDIQFLTFTSGYTNFTSCARTDTVGSCDSSGTNGLQSPANIGLFYYDGGHMQKHATLTTGMDLGAMNNAALAAEMTARLGNDITLSYSQPQLAGGVVTTAKDYAVFLRKLLNNQLQMASFLNSHPVCTNPATCATAVYSPITAMSWQYSIGHWIEDDPTSGDGSFSSAGAFGFYPWVDASKSYYGIVARHDLGGAALESIRCGVLIRKAWMTGVAQ